MLILAVGEYKDLLELCRVHEAKLADSDLHGLGVELYSCKLSSGSSEFCDSAQHGSVYPLLENVSGILELGERERFLECNETGSHHILKIYLFVSVCWHWGTEGDVAPIQAVLQLCADVFGYYSYCSDKNVEQKQLKEGRKGLLWLTI